MTVDIKNGMSVMLSITLTRRTPIYMPCICGSLLINTVKYHIMDIRLK